VPVLLLAQGDTEAKELLRKAIEARYGLRPPALESLQIDFKGRVRAKVGPVTTWLPVEATAYFQFPTSMRWDFSVKPIGVSVQRGVEAFDGTTYRRMRGSSAPQVINLDQQVKSIQRRLWAIAALFLTPLGDHFVRLTTTGPHTLDATNTTINDTVSLNLRPDKTLDYVQVTCLNPDTDQQQSFTLRLSSNQSAVNEFMLPRKISAFWDDSPYFEVEPVTVDSNPQFTETRFTLAPE
jgi:hypothetical protein